MKILVLSDSHSALSFMRACVDAVCPDAIIHLGDYYEDGKTIAQEYPSVPVYQVPGNCDRYRVEPHIPQILIHPVFGVDLYMTHGHMHNVKLHLSALLRDARASRCAAALFGHTHEAVCFREDGLWVMNPGSCGYFGGTAGIIEIQNKRIIDCRIIRYADLEEMK